MTNGPEAVVLRGIEAGLYPGAAFAYGTAETRFEQGVGLLGPDKRADAVDSSTLYDLASLTKVLCTTPLTFVAVGEGLVTLSDMVYDHIPEFPDRKISIRNLLLHDSGLPDYLEGAIENDANETWHKILGLAPVARPGERTIYSCLGFVLLKEILERVYGDSLDSLFRTKVAGTLGLGSVQFGPVAHAAPTGSTQSGIVHDPLARCFGGVSGNAGLFGAVGDIAGFAQAVMNKRGPFENPGWDKWTVRSGSLKERGLGWDKKSRTESCAGEKMSDESFGHTGFTGTMVWIDPCTSVFAILLTNAVVLNPDRVALRKLRAEFCDAVSASILG